MGQEEVRVIEGERNKDQTRGSEWGGGEGQKIGTIK
jgi:hypothetical protein